MHLEGSTMLPRTRDVPQIGEMHILSQRSGISQHDSGKRRNIDGPHQTQSHLRMVPIGQRQGCTILPGILQFLPEIHPFLL